VSRPPEFKLGFKIEVLPLLSYRKSSAPHPAEPELPSARAKLRALRSADRSAAASGGCVLGPGEREKPFPKWPPKLLNVALAKAEEEIAHGVGAGETLDTQ
jgi:hypothetical protein